MAHQRAVADVVRQQPVRRAVHVVHRRQRLQHRGDQHGPHLHPAQAARPSGRTADADRSHELRPKLAAVPGHPRLPADAADDPHRRPAHEGALPVHAAGRRPRRSSTTGRRSSTTGCGSCPACRTSTRDLQITSPQVLVDIDRDKAVGPRRDARTRSRPRSAAPTARKQVSTIYTPTNQYWVILELDPQYQQDPTALSRLYVRVEQRAAGAARRGGQAHAAGWAR